MNEREIFVAALELTSDGERQTFLAEACQGDTALRERMERLLKEQSRLGSFLDLPAADIAATQIYTDNTDPDEQYSERTTPFLEPVVLDFLAPAEQPGSLGRLGQYDILEVVGRGGMGIVLKAHDAKLQRIVAVKVLAPELASNPTARKRFLREAQAAAAVSHDHVVTIYAVEDNDNQLPYLVMEFIDGQSLQQKLDAEGQLELKEVLRIGSQIAEGLAAAHRQGLIHRDIKPSNILLQNGVQRVQITDFGLARAVDDVGMTKTGEVTGTPQYMSPEQAQGHPVDVRSDLFSLGSVLYAMCTGRSPFRADTSVAVLRRVCDDVPRPIREINPDIPDWLTAIINRILAKRPDDRFQTAAEVAELLGRHLAHVQNPSSTPFPGNAGPTRLRPKRATFRLQPWQLAMLALIALSIVIGVTDATGVTNLSSTVLRIVTGEGTLVIEIDDPTVEISLDGEELRITGAGLQELRLRPGQYQFQATRDGETISQELVTISRNGREVVRVTQEPIDTSVVPPVAGSPVERGAFVILSPDGREVARVDRLADAVQRSSSGDTIEIHSNGTFDSQPIQVDQGTRVIRAGSGFQPILNFNCDSVGDREVALQFQEGLVLEGLELRWSYSDAGSPQPFVEPRGLIGTTGKLFVANCTFRGDGPNGPLTVIGFMDTEEPAEVRNCLFVNTPHSAIARSAANGITVIDNCVLASRHFSTLLGLGRPQQGRFRLRHCTLVAEGHAIHTGDPEFSTAPVRFAEVEADGNIFDAELLWFFHEFDNTAQELDFEGGRAESLLPQRCAWSGRVNVYHIRSEFASWYSEFDNTIVNRWQGPTDLAGWKALWNTAEEGSIEGTLRYQGGDILSLLGTSPDTMTADDFRLRPDSAGYRAGPNGEDLGANIDFVGPGEAYEKWKQTPDYFAWQAEVSSMTTSVITRSAEESPVNPQSIQVLTPEGDLIAAFDTLAAAVAHSNSGDTIEIRGNGPYFIEPMVIPHALWIRAGEGFHPVISDHPTFVPTNDDALLTAQNALVLEGLEFRASRIKASLLWAGGSCLAVNCRFVSMSAISCIGAASNLELVNCELLRPGSASIVIDDHNSGTPAACEIDIENCVAIGHVNLDLFAQTRECRMRLAHSTVIETTRDCALFLLTRYATESADLKPIEFQATGNTFASENSVLGFLDAVEASAAVEAPQLEQLLQDRVQWRDMHNLYDLKETYLQVFQANQPNVAPYRGLAEWVEFWGAPDDGCSEGVVRFQGGNLNSRAMTAPESLSPADFALRPDSAGYAAGPNGENLGVDVEFLGPGEAFARWKKTDTYAAWIAETNQQFRD